MRILFGIVLVILGALLVIKTEPIYNFFGPVPFAEKYIHSEGGSRLFYKLIGITIILVGFSLITGLHRGFFEWIGRSLFGGFVPEA